MLEKPGTRFKLYCFYFRFVAKRRYRFYNDVCFLYLYLKIIFLVPIGAREILGETLIYYPTKVQTRSNFLEVDNESIFSMRK